MTRNTAPMIAARAEKAKEREQYVLTTISAMMKAGEKVSFYSVQKKTGCSKSYLHNNERIAGTIRTAAGEISKEPDDVSAAVLLKAAHEKIRALEKELDRYRAEDSETYKKKYEKLLEENRELKKQLECAYKYE